MNRGLVALMLLALCGCTSAQLSYGTVNVASTIEDIQVQQVLGALARSIEDPYALPSQAALTGGTVQVLNSVTPSVTAPLSNMYAKLVASSPTFTTTTAGSSATLGASISWQQNFNIVPITDPAALRNLAAIFRAVTMCKWSELVDYTPPRIYGREDLLFADPYYLEKPNCVLCAKDPNELKDLGLQDPLKTPTTVEDLRKYDLVEPNPLVFPTNEETGENNCWLSAQRASGPSLNGGEKLGSAGGFTFYADHRKRFLQLLLLALPPTTAPARFASITKPAPTPTPCPCPVPPPSVLPEGAPKALQDKQMDVYRQQLEVQSETLKLQRETLRQQRRQLEQPQEGTKFAPGPAEGTQRPFSSVLPGILPQQQ